MVKNIEMKRWRYAFPMTNFWPAMREPSSEDQKLAERYCPILYVDPELFKQERGVLAQNLGIKGIPIAGLLGLLERLRHRDLNTAAEAIYHFCTSPEYDPNGALLWMFSQINRVLDEIRQLSDIYKSSKEFYSVDSSNRTPQQQAEFSRDRDRNTLLANLFRELEDQLSDRNGLHKKYIAELFRNIFHKSTFVIKYHVVHHPEDPNLRCIQYFAYWPIQIFPHHFFDYEPVYVFIHKIGKGAFEPLLIAFNAAPNLPTTLKTIRYLYRKRPGHLIRVFFDWNVQYNMTEDWEKVFVDWPREYNTLGDAITEAYSGQYIYEKLPEVGELESYDESMTSLSHISRVFKKEGRPTLRVHNYWHAFDLCPDELLDNTDMMQNFQPHPLMIQDLLHIEWNITNPFQIPFLYPTVGGKEPLMHVPLNLKDLIDRTNLDRAIIWQLYCSQVRSSTDRSTSTWSIGTRTRAQAWTLGILDLHSNIYRAGHLVEFLYTRQSKLPETIRRLWQDIDTFIDYVKSYAGGYRELLRRELGILTDPIDQSYIEVQDWRPNCPKCGEKMEVNPYTWFTYCACCSYEGWQDLVDDTLKRLKDYTEKGFLEKVVSLSMIDKLERMLSAYIDQDDVHAAYNFLQEFIDIVDTKNAEVSDSHASELDVSMWAQLKEIANMISRGIYGGYKNYIQK